MVERANGYLETSFLPGRTFTGPGDFNIQLEHWLAHRANVRHHRRIACRPADRIVADMQAMVRLPPVAPVVGWRTSTRLARDHYAGSPPTTTPSTPRRSAGWSRSSPTWIRSR